MDKEVEDKDYIGGSLVFPKQAYIKEYDCLKVESVTYLDDALIAKPESTTILSKAIEQIEQMGDYRVMVALVDLDKSELKEERLYTFCDIESKKLREAIYKRMEEEA